MKCRFEHDGDCCNSGSPQYMCKCKPDVCHSEVPITNEDRVRSMSTLEMASFLCAIDWRLGEEAECAEWLRQPAEEG